MAVAKLPFASIILEKEILKLENHIMKWVLGCSTLCFRKLCFAIFAIILWILGNGIIWLDVFSWFFIFFFLWKKDKGCWGLGTLNINYRTFLPILTPELIIHLSDICVALFSRLGPIAIIVNFFSICEAQEHHNPLTQCHWLEWFYKKK